jgi:hypothetical protein
LQMDTKRFARFSRPGHKVTGNRATTGAQKRERVGWEFVHSIGVCPIFCVWSGVTDRPVGAGKDIHDRHRWRRTV